MIKMRILFALYFSFLFSTEALAYNCPDDKYDMVVAISIDQATDAAEAIVRWGGRAGFTVKLLIPAHHTARNLLDWMQCSLSLFVNISHSARDTIITTDEVNISGNEIRDNVNFKGRTVVYSHSCNSSNGTLQGSLVNGFREAKARGFIGTNRSVFCGGRSEDMKITKCVMRSVLVRNKRFQAAIETCNEADGTPNFLVVNDFDKGWDLGLVTPDMSLTFTHNEL